MYFRAARQREQTDEWAIGEYVLAYYEDGENSLLYIPNFSLLHPFFLSFFSLISTHLYYYFLLNIFFIFDYKYLDIKDLLSYVMKMQYFAINTIIY